MFKKISTVLLVILFSSSLLFTQDQVIKRKTQLIIDPSTYFEGNSTLRGTDIPSTAANYIAVDTMHNAFGPGSATINPLAYDSASNTLALVYRGNGRTFAASSGELWYSISTDMGQTWTRVGSINSATPLFARYPSMTIVNTTEGDISNTIGAFGYPQLNPSAFGHIGYGADQPLGGNAAFAEIDEGPPTYSSNVPTFTDNNYIYWASDNQDDASIRFFRTQDYSTVEKIDPPQWTDTIFSSNGNIALGGVAYNGVVYYGVFGPFSEEIGPGGWEFAYSKSLDNGSTWSSWFIVNWLNIPTTAAFDEIWDWKTDDVNIISYSGDINVDKNGHVHIITGMTDTASGRNAIVEFFETAEGVWDAKIVADSIKNNPWFDPGDDGAGNAMDPALGQMGYAPYLATNKGRDFFVAQWVQGSPAAGDSLCDIYMKYRKLDGEWSSAAVNLTETNGMNDDGAHLAPQLAVVETGGLRSYYAFSMYWYESGVTTPTINSINAAVTYVAAVPVFSEPLVGIGNIDPSEFSFDLSQNYPNPFNPSTLIKFTIAERSNVTLKVFDVLGREVATLVNTTKEAGSYSVNFDAANFASGLYVYTLNAGDFNSSKKMMLLK
jgi:hypothetical protein